jgi:carboxylesterase type B
MDWAGGVIAGTQDIIVITINYRLNALGFLHLKGEADASGNQGLLDQNMALKWIFENAATFGGDKDKITIGGQSAGAWSVGYHLFMPSSWSYFRNGILQSGGPTTISKSLYCY